MAINITTNGEHRHDQSSGVQSGGGLDKDDVSLSNTLAELPDPFENFLVALGIPLALRDNAADYEAAWETPVGDVNEFFVEVEATNGETLNDLFFSKSDGSLFNGEIATYNSAQIHVVGSVAPIYLYSFAGGDILIGTTQAAGVDITDPTTLDASQLVFAYYLEENATHTGADIWGVTFQPLDHPIAGDNTLGEHDDPIDLFDFLHVSASASLSFEFDTLESGKFLWVAVGDSNNGLLVTGRDLNVDGSGNRVSGGNDPSDAVNTSQGGTGATIGINNQLWVPGNEGVFTLVQGFTALGSGPDATGDLVTQIDYADYINTTGAGLFISQKQGSPAQKLDMTISVWEADANLATPALEPEEGFAYIGAEGPPNDGTSGSFEDDTAVPVQTVTVTDNSDPNNPVLIGTWILGDPSNGSTQNGVTINISGNEIEVDDVDEFYTISWTVDDPATTAIETFNRFRLTANDGKFDVGRVDVDRAELVTQNIGADVIIHDDGPVAAIELTGDMVEHDETPGQDLTSDDQPDASAPPSPITALETAETLTRMGWARSGTAVVQTAAGNDPGTDGEKSQSFELSIPNLLGTDSGIVAIINAAGDIREVSLFLETWDGEDIVVGRVDDAGGNPQLAGAVAFAVMLDDNLKLVLSQYLPALHLDGVTPLDVVSITDTALQVVSVLADNDDDTDDASLDIGNLVKIRDDEPDDEPSDPFPLDEDNIASVNPNLDEDSGDPSDTHTRTDNLVLIIDPSVDLPVTFQLKAADAAEKAATEAALAAANPGLQSKGEDVLFDVNAATGTVTLFVDNTTSNDGVLGGDDRLVATWVVTAAGMATMTLMDQIDHPDPVERLEASGGGVDDDDQEEELSLNLTAALRVLDRDFDEVSLDANFAVYPVEDDMPDIGDGGANVDDGSEDVIPNAAIDFAEPGTPGEVSSKTVNLEAVIGTDENIGGGGVTITDWDAEILYGSQPDPDLRLLAQISGDAKTVSYFEDENNDGVLQAGETTEFFRFSVDDTNADSTQWTYTWQAFEPPPPALLEFDFTDLPSGQNLHGTIAANKADLGGLGLLVFPAGATLNPDGTYITGGQNSSPTLNTSKGGGPVTIGNSNQMIDPGEGMFFVFVNNPDDDSVAGVTGGLTQNTADDADEVGFAGTFEVGTSQVEIVQVQGGSPASMDIFAYDITLDSPPLGDGGNTAPNVVVQESRDFVKEPLDAVTSNTPRNITEVKVLDGGDGTTLIFHATESGGVQFDATGGAITANFGLGEEVRLTGIEDNYTVEITTTAGDHDLVLVRGVAGKFDIGGFNLLQAQPLPDKVQNWELTITDFEGDFDVATTTTGIDGTGDPLAGGFDDDNVAGVGTV